MLGAATAAILTRVLDRSGVAQVLVALSVGTTVGVVCQAGLPLAIAHKVARVRVGSSRVQDLRRDLRDASLFVLLPSTLVVLASLPPWPLDPTGLIPGGDKSLLIAAAVIGTSRALSRILSEVNKGYGQVNVAGLGAELAGPILGVGGIVAAATLAPGGLTGPMALWILAGGWMAAVVLTSLLAPVRPGWEPGSPSDETVRNVVGVLAAISILNVGIQQAHVVLAGLMLPLGTAASFATAARLAPVAGTPLILLSAIASPDVGVAVQPGGGDRLQQMEARLQRVTGLLFLVSLLLVAVFALAGERVLGLIFGAEYSDARIVLVVLALGPLASLGAGVAGLCLIQAGRRRRVLLDTLLGSGVALAGMVVGARSGGALGLAIGYSVGQAFTNALLLRSCRAELGILPFGRPLAGCRWLLGMWRARGGSSRPD